MATTPRMLVWLTAILVLPALAQNDATEEVVRTDAELEASLSAARQRLEEAAREVAELSERLIEDIDIDFDFAHRVRPFERRAMLGLNIGVAPEGGVAVIGVTPEGPADRAGLVAGDVLIGVNGMPLDGRGRVATHQLLEALAEVEPGSEVALRYRRDGAERDVRLVAEAAARRVFEVMRHDGPEGELRFQMPRPLMEPLAPFLRRWGEMELVSVSADLGRYFGADTGLLVVRAPRDATLGLRDGDVILSIGGRRPTSPSHAMRILSSYAPGERLELEIMRDRQRRNLDVELPGKVAEAATPAEP